MACLGGIPRLSQRGLSPLLRRDFPRLSRYAETSAATWAYNCHGWGADDDTAWWEPISSRPPHVPAWVRVYWPEGLPKGDYSLANFQAAFATRGFESSSDGSLESGVEKIALYAKGDRTTHTARQLPWGHWTSKLGTDVDIEHETPEELEGPSYGTVAAFMWRPAQAHRIIARALN